jgi:hypothetical protein
MRAYAAVGGIESAPQIMFTFRLHGGAPQRTEAG